MVDPLTWKLNEAVYKLIDAEKDFAVACCQPVDDPKALQALVKKLRARRSAYSRELQKIYEATTGKS